MAKSPNPKDCLSSQRIVCIEVSLEQLLRLSFGTIAESTQTPRITPSSVTFLHTVNMRRLERNWIPWLSHGDGLLLSYSLEPHVVLSCKFRGTGHCAEIARTDFQGLSSYLKVPASEVHGGSQGVVWDKRTALAIGHVHNRTRSRRLYRFFFYTFLREPPFTVEQVGVPFGLIPRGSGMQRQFLSGLSRHEDWFLVSYGKLDEEAWVSILHRCDVVELLAGGIQRPVSIT